MSRFLLALAATAVAATAGFAHFVFVLPKPDGTKVEVVLSDELAPDEQVTSEKMKGMKLTVRDAAGKDATIETTAGAHTLTAALMGTGPRVVFGSLAYGVMQRGDAKPYLLSYHPKTVIGAVADDKLVLGDKAIPVELVPVAAGSEVRFKFLAAGMPVADAEVTVLKPGGGSVKVKTDANGLTPAQPAAGQYGAWAKTIEAKAGEHGGKKYDEARHYATLVVEFKK
jgi:uncharacterized GH25 family protein